MAAKVNKKFVAILIVSLVAVLGLAGLAAAQFVLKSGEDWARRGEKAMAAGEYDQARIAFQRAVAKDRSRVDWMERWLDAVRQWTPESETEYSSEFGRTYYSVLRARAIAKSTDVAAHDEHLALLWRQMLLGGYSRNAADSLAEQVGQALARFPADQSGPQDALRRYRGLAREMVYAAGDTISSEDQALIAEDLKAALAVKPADSEVACALARWHGLRAQDAEAAGRFQESVAEMDQAVAIIDRFLGENPGDPRALVHRISLGFDRERMQQTRGKLPDEAVAIVNDLISDRLPAISAAADALSAMDPANADVTLISRLQALEGLAQPEARFALTRGVLASWLTKEPDNAAWLLVSARMDEVSGDTEAAIATLQKVSSLPDLPMSLDGLLRFGQRREALARECALTLQKYASADAAPENAASRDALLTRARDLRGQYARQVSESDVQLMYLDGLLNQVVGKNREALSAFRRYNEQTAGRDPRGLWAQGQTAAAVNENGLAERSFRDLLALQPENTAAITALGEVLMRLRREDEALGLFQRLLQFDPSNTAIAERVRLLRAAANPEAATDPVTRAMLTARRQRFGDAVTPPDVPGAEQTLLTAFDELGQNPSIARELILLQLDTGKLDAARETAARAAAGNPDDEGIAQLNQALSKGTSITDALVRLIDESDLPEVDKLLNKSATYRQAGMADEARAAIAQAFALSPDDPRAFELRFLDAISASDTAQIEKMVQAASEKNLDRVNGAIYRARAQAAAGDREASIATLNTAIAQGAAEPGVFRLLASQQNAAGRTSEAIASYERSLALRPDDVPTVVEYVASLAAAGRMEDALSAARRMERYGRGNERFQELWMRLEASTGGEAGRELAIRRREALAQQQPSDVANRAELASLYMQALRWSDARTIIDAMRSENDSLQLAVLDARWHADQGRVTVDGRPMDGVEAANSVLIKYILSLPEAERTAEPYLTLARFMVGRGRLDIAERAIQQARTRQDPTTMEADKLYGDLALQQGLYDIAFDTYQKILEAGADDAEQTYRQRLIEAALRIGRYDEAESELGRLTGPAAESIVSMLQRSDAAAGRGDERRAREILDAAVQRYPSDPRVYTKRAQSMLGRPELINDAVADLNTAVQLAPNDWRTLRVRGSLLYTQGRTDDAMRDMRAALRANPDLDDVLVNVLTELTRQGRERDAYGVAEEVFAARPSDPTVYFTVSQVFRDAGSFERAAQALQVGWDRMKQPSLGLAYVAVLLRQTPPKVREAESVMQGVTAAMSDPNASPVVLLTQAQIARVKNDRARADQLVADSFSRTRPETGFIQGWADALSRSMEGRPETEVVSTLRKLRGVSGLSTEASRGLDLAIGRAELRSEATREEGYATLGALRSADSTDAAARIAFQAEGSARYAAKDFAGAKRVWAEGTERFPDDREMANNLAYLLVTELNDPAAALPLAEKAVSTGQPVAQFYDTLASVYMAMNRLDEAESTLKTADRLATTASARIQVLINRAELELLRGRPKTARAFYGEIQSLLAAAGSDRDELMADAAELLTHIDAADR